jgi:hypothetical protein
MTTTRTMVWAAMLVLAVGGCHSASENDAAMASPAAPPAPMTGGARAADGNVGLLGQQNAEGSFLAYSHDATIRVDAAAIGARVDAVRDACMTRKFGECAVLGESQQAGDYPNGMLQLRAEPKAIQPLVGLAAEGAELAARSTSAEDLADAVRDNGLRRSRLEKQHARLLEFLDRDDLTAESLVALTGQLAQIEADLQYAEQEAAQQQRRINTNLLTLHFQTDGVTVETSALRQSFREAGDVLDNSAAVLVTIAVALLPFAVMGVIGFFVIRALWRRRRRATAVAKAP